MPFREVSVADDIASVRVINSIGVSVEELLNFQIDRLLNYGSGGLANVGVKLSGILKWFLEVVADGSGSTGDFDVTLVHRVSSCPRWAAEW